MHVKHKTIFRSNQPSRDKFIGFQAFPHNSYLTESKIQEIYPTKSSFSSAYLHEAAEGMDINVYYGNHGRGRIKKTKKEKNATCRSWKNKKQYFFKNSD